MIILSSNKLCEVAEKYFTFDKLYLAFNINLITRLLSIFYIPYYLYKGKRDTKLRIGINHELPFWKFMKTNV